mmetsp:Transcript_60360/g.95643  ORF Transcript_60360/g.95643 Transcript_60360/m.95643 type:complete len:284 (-) Transcript_60360:733-1584(-)
MIRWKQDRRWKKTSTSSAGSAGSACDLWSSTMSCECPLHLWSWQATTKAQIRRQVTYWGRRSGRRLWNGRLRSSRTQRRLRASLWLWQLWLLWWLRAQAALRHVWNFACIPLPRWLGVKSWFVKLGCGKGLLWKAVDLLLRWAQSCILQIQLLQLAHHRRLAIGKVHQLETQLFLEEIQVFCLFTLEHQGNHPSHRAKTCRAAAPVEVGLLLYRQTQVHHHVHVLCIDASRHKVRAHQHAILEALQASKGLCSPRLLHSPSTGSSRNTCLVQQLSDLDGTVGI